MDETVLALRDARVVPVVTIHDPRNVDAILGGHTHDGVPVAIPVKNAGGTTLVTNAGSHGKFLGVMDFDVKGGKLVDFRYRLVPVFADVLKADPAMDALITKLRAPYEAQLAEKLAVTDGLLYRRGNFNGSWDQLVCDALMDVQGAEIAFSPGFRWGTTLLPGDTITREATYWFSASTCALNATSCCVQSCSVSSSQLFSWAMGSGLNR